MTNTSQQSTKYGMPGGSTYCGTAAGTFHVPTFSVTGSGDPGGKGNASALQLAQNSHVGGAAHQASTYSSIR